ncbi:MAG: hypothetical protein Q9227_004099 [Pyrenula ochraceoflavens]
MAPKIPLWLDCDPGHDDAVAILLAAYHPDLELLGVSTVHGNASVDHCTQNALSLLEAIGRPEVPVYRGAKKPFCRSARHAPTIHGKSGLDGTQLLPEPKRRPLDHCNTILDMRDAIMQCPENTAWIVATGALTNVALLISTFPEVVPHLLGLSIMGGAIGNKFTSVTPGPAFRDESGQTRERIGNETPYAEFNIWCDPEAAHSLFSNTVLSSKITLIPLDLTHQAFANKDVQTLVLHGRDETAKPTKLRQMYYELLMFFAYTYSNVFNLTEGPPVHDPLAVAILLMDRENLEARVDFNDNGGERWQVEVACAGVELGRTKASKLSDGVGGIKIPRSLDVSKFWSVINQCMELADARLGYLTR